MMIDDDIFTIEDDKLFQIDVDKIFHEVDQDIGDNLRNTKKQKKSPSLAFGLLALTNDTIQFNEIEGESKKRRAKAIRNREESWSFITSWDDNLFRRQFRLSREDFFLLCEKCKSVYPGKSTCGMTNYQFALTKGRNSTPCSGPITMEIKLAITLRILAGASYLDLIWYGVQLDSVHPIFLFTLKLLDEVLPNKEIFNFDPTDDEAFGNQINQIASEWSSIMVRKKGFDLFKGTILAGDGLVVPIVAPTEDDRNGLDLGAFRNRFVIFRW